MWNIKIDPAAVTYAPVVISYVSEEESFQVTFLMAPECKVLVTGARPSYEKFFGAVEGLMLPILVVECLYVATMVAFDVEDAGSAIDVASCRA